MGSWRKSVALLSVASLRFEALFKLSSKYVEHCFVRGTGINDFQGPPSRGARHRRLAHDMSIMGPAAPAEDPAALGAQAVGSPTQQAEGSRRALSLPSPH